MSVACAEARFLTRNDQPGPETVLLVKGSSHDGEPITLNGRLITIGSSSNCDLRLLARGVKPLHGFLVRGRVNTVYRACEGQLTLNGEPTLEGIIHPGDRLGVGPVELIFMPDNRLQANASSERALPVGNKGHEEVTSEMETVEYPSQHGISQPDANVTSDVPMPGEYPPGAAEQVCPATPTGQHVTASEVRQLVKSYLKEIGVGGPVNLAGVQAEISDLRQALVETRELVSRLQSELQAWTEKTADWFETTARMAPQLDGALQETHRQQTAIEELIGHVRAELERLDRMEAEVVRRQIDLAAERSRLEQTATALASREEALAASGSATSGIGDYPEVRGQVDPGDARLKVLDGSQLGDAIDSQESDGRELPLDGRVATATWTRTSCPSDGAVATPSEDRRAEHGSTENSKQAETSSKCEKAVPYLPAPENATTDCESDHEFVIQDYLARLLGKPVARPPESKDRPPNNAAASTHCDGAPGNAGKVGATEKLRKVLADSTRQRPTARRRVRAPEKNANLAAMRELANLSSQAAIDRYAKAKLARVQREKLTVVLVSLLCGFGLTLLDLWVGIGQLGRSAMLLSFIVVVVYLIQYGILTGRLVINSKGQLQLAERRIGREMRKLLPSNKPSLVEESQDDRVQIQAAPESVV